MTGTALPTVLGTGSRDYEDVATLHARLDGLLKGWGPLHVIHGAARGFDRAMGEWAWVHRPDGVTVQPYPAAWRGPARRGAGAVRNQLMVDTRPQLVLIGLQSGAANDGTLDCAKRVLRAQLPWLAWWGGSASTSSRPVRLDELKRLIEQSEKTKADRRAEQRRRQRADQTAWMEDLGV